MNTQTDGNYFGYEVSNRWMGGSDSDRRRGVSLAREPLRPDDVHRQRYERDRSHYYPDAHHRHDPGWPNDIECYVPESDRGESFYQCGVVVGGN